LLQADEVAVLPAGHRLLDKPRLPRGLRGQSTSSAWPPADPYRQAIDQMFQQLGVVRRLSVEAASAVSVCALVRQGLGVAIVNPLTALELSGAGLQVRPLAVAIEFHVGLVLPELRAPSPLLPAFVACLQDAARALHDRLDTLRGNPQMHRAVPTST
jgi:DNA-binding transcriptional LysR family regulator